MIYFKLLLSRICTQDLLLRVGDTHLSAARERERENFYVLHIHTPSYIVPSTEDQSAEIAMQHMDQQYAPLHLVSMVSKYGTQQQIDNAKDSDLLTKERLCRALSMFEVVMQRIKAILGKNEQVSGVQ